MYRRKGGLRQKPWNKPGKMDMFWSVDTVTANIMGGDLPMFHLPAGASSSEVIVGLDASIVSSALSATTPGAAGQNCKLHRFQGYIWAFLSNQDDQDGYHVTSSFSADGSGDGDSSSVDPRPNMQMLNYVWLKAKEGWQVPNTPGTTVNTGLTVAQTYEPKMTKIANMLLRDDIISWGCVPVRGNTPVTYNKIQTGGSPGSVLWNMPTLPNVNFGAPTRIPFPRLPKAGLNLRKGESLLCVVNGWDPTPNASITLEDNFLRRGIQILPQFRIRCSAG